jgi:hypothetical protein
VLVARALGRRVHSVSVTLEDGAVRGAALAQDASPAEVEQALAVAFAGVCAERHVPREPMPRIWTRKNPWLSGGEATAQALAVENGDSKRPHDGELIAYWEGQIGSEAVERARALAEELVEREAAIGRLETLAIELLFRSHLSGADIEQILERRTDG